MTNLTINTKNYTIRDWFSSDLADLREWKGGQADALLQEYMADEHILAVQSDIDLKIVGLFRLSELGAEAEDLDDNLIGRQIGFEFISQDIAEAHLSELLGSIVEYYLVHEAYDFLICMPETSGAAIKHDMESVGFSLIDPEKNMYLLRNDTYLISEVAAKNVLTEFIVRPYSNAQLKLMALPFLFLILYALPIYLLAILYPPQCAIIMGVATVVFSFGFVARELVELRISNREIIVKNLMTRIRHHYSLSDLKTCFAAYDVAQRRSFQRETYIRLRFTGSLMKYKLKDTDYSNWQTLVDYLEYEGVLTTYRGSTPFFS